jgi:hypothetical protein
MRVVSDFLDRVASRAMGGEALLAPRVPSLFEPVQRDGRMTAVETREVGAPASTNVYERDEAARAPADEAPLRAVPDSDPTSVQSMPVREEVAALRVAPVRSALARNEREAQPQAMRPVKLPSDAEAARPAVESRIRHEHVHHQVTLSAHDADDGALLPPRGAVFSTQPMGRDRHARETARQQARTDRHPDGMEHEPVVHVSIGRLEVRAGPTSAPTSRHPEAPRRNAFDDYLRERGKASP